MAYKETPTKEDEMSKEETINMKRAAQKTRRETLKTLKKETLTDREVRLLTQILELAHKSICEASLALDLLDLVS